VRLQATVFSFVIRNAYEANNGSLLHLHIGEGAGSPRIASTRMLGLPVTWSKVAPEFRVKWIGSSNAIKGALTQISVTLQPNADLLPGEQVLISHLLGSSTLSGTISMQQLDFTVFVTQPIWDQKQGTLLLTVQKGKVLSQHQITRFVFPLRNSPELSIGVQPQISANPDGVWKQTLRDTAVFTDGYTEFLPATMQVQGHNETFQQCVKNSFREGALVTMQTCGVDKVQSRHFSHTRPRTPAHTQRVCCLLALDSVTSSRV